MTSIRQRMTEDMQVRNLLGGHLRSGQRGTPKKRPTKMVVWRYVLQRQCGGRHTGSEARAILAPKR